MAQIERKFMAHYIDASFGGTANYVRLGKDLEEFNIELNPDTETSKNILGETTFKHNGYEPTADADPFYASTGDPLFEQLQSIFDNRSQGDDCKTYAVEAHLWDGSGSSYVAYRQECYVVPTSAGGDTSGYQIPFTVTYAGERVKGTFDTDTFTFTEA